MDACVIDASAVIPFVVPQPLTDKAELLLAQAQGTLRLRLLAPDILYAECANALWRYERRGDYDAESMVVQLARIMDLPVDVTSTRHLAEDALLLAIAYGISAYDACYAALADREGCPLITGDQPLLRRLAGSPISVQWLGVLEAGGGATAA